jgi:hypothetical protein
MMSPSRGVRLPRVARLAMLRGMNQRPPPRAKPTAATAKLAARRAREAEALRSNLRKRKDQARAREKPRPE